MIVRFFDCCYRKGVYEACELGDEHACREFIKARRANDSFGLLNVDGEMEWKEFRFNMLLWCREARIYSFAEKVLMKITSVNYHWILLPLCLDFYIWGIEDYLSYPNSFRFEAYKRTSHERWFNSRGTKRTLKPDDYIGKSQIFAYDRVRREKEMENMPSAVLYETFCSALWSLTRKLPTIKEVDDNEGI